MVQTEKLVMPDNVRKELERIIEKENIKNPKIELNSVTKKGDNYVGNLLGITVMGSNKNLHLICKSETENELIKQMYRTSEMFEKEKFAYLKCFPLYERFQKLKGVSAEDGFFNYPKCYSFTDVGIFMADLREQNYVMLDKYKDATFESAKLTMEALGKFHAIGLAVKDQWPEEFEECKSYLGKDLYAKPIQEESYNYFEATLKFSSKTLDRQEEYLRAKILKAADNIRDLLPMILDGESAEPYSTFTHGDFWNNNILYKLDKSGKPTKACIVDYQAIRYSTPVTDITEYLFTCTSQKFRDQHYTELLKIYHRSLSTVLEKLGSDPHKVFPFAALEDQMRQFGLFGILFSSLMLKIVLSKGHDTYDPEKYAEMMKDNKDFAKGMQLITDDDTYEVFKEKMSNIIRHANSIGMI